MFASMLMPLLCFQTIGTWMDSIYNTWFDHWWPRAAICTERGSLQCSPFSFFRPQHHSVDDWAGDYQAVCARATASSAKSGSPYGIMAGAADFVAPRPLAVTVGNYLLMYADGRFARHPRFRYFAQHRDVLAGTTGRPDLCPPAPTWCPALFLDCVNMVVILSSLFQSQAMRRNVHVRSDSPPNALHSSSLLQYQYEVRL